MYRLALVFLLVDCDRSVPVTGTITRCSDDYPLAGATVELAYDDGTRGGATTDKDGGYVVRVKPPKEWHGSVSAAAPRYKAASRRMLTSTEQEDEQDLCLEIADVRCEQDSDCPEQYLCACFDAGCSILANFHVLSGDGCSPNHMCWSPTSRSHYPIRTDGGWRIDAKPGVVFQTNEEAWSAAMPERPL